MEIAKRNIHILYKRHVRPVIRRMSTVLSNTPSEKAFAIPEEDLAIPRGSLVLVTGATGYIASHIVNELLKLGYRVRGTVRDESKAATIRASFDDDDNFETCIVTDLTDEHGFDKAIEGCAGVIHTASIVSFSPNPNEVVPPTVAGAINILKSAKKAGTVKRVVYTSSSVAATVPILDKVFPINKDTWNDASLEKVKAMTEPYKPEGAMDVYAASKTEAERAVWKFVADEKPDFVVNSVLPNMNLGKVLNVAGITASQVPSIYKGEFQQTFSPQWWVDVADDAKIHVAALVDRTVEGERIYAFAEPFDWNDIIDAVRKVRPEKEGVTERLGPHGKDLSQVDNERGRELLGKWFGMQGWTSLEDSVRDNLEGM